MNKFIRRISISLLYKISCLISSDKLYLNIMYYLQFGRPLNLNDPKSFNEKLQWLKLYDRRPEYTKMVDKYEVKKIVASIIGEEFVIPTLGIYRNADEIDFDKLPCQFALKCTQDSGGVVICEDKRFFDEKKAIKKLNKGLKHNFYWTNREWPYKNVIPRIIAEQYLSNDGKELTDYKFYCFNGSVKLLLVASGRMTGHKTFAYFDKEWNPIDLTWGAPRPDTLPIKPDNFNEMIRIANLLSEGIPHVRVDLYNVNGDIYFGELTFYDAGGFGVMQPSEWDEKLGKYIELS